MRTYKLKVPPTVNHLYTVSNGRKILSTKGKAYYWEVAAEVLRGGRLPPMTGRLRVEMKLHTKDRRTRDLDNVLKAALDGLNKADVFVDDGQIDQLYIERGKPIHSDPHLVVTVTVIGESHDRNQNGNQDQ